MAELGFDYVSRSFSTDEGVVHALTGLNLQIDDGEFFSIVGRSGCGKSTALRIAAGLETPDHGRIRCDHQDITNTPPYERKFGMVTQQNALLRFRNAGRNISLPLELRKENHGEIKDRVTSEAEQFTVAHLLRQRKGQLSGGETQAVQLARALVARPRVLLLDEPFARIDLDLRLKLRGDVVRVQREYGVTTLLVTGNQEDAMVLSDRLAVLDSGRLQQVGSPIEVYDRPINVTVAKFLGEPAMNVLSVPVVDDRGMREYVIGGARFPAHPPITERFLGGNALVGIRPERIVVDQRRSERAIPAEVERIELRGSSTVVGLRFLHGSTSNGRRPDVLATVNGVGPKVGASVGVVLDPAQFHLFDAYTEAALVHPL